MLLNFSEYLSRNYVKRQSLLPLHRCKPANNFMWTSISHFLKAVRYVLFPLLTVPGCTTITVKIAMHIRLSFQHNPRSYLTNTYEIKWGVEEAMMSRSSPFLCENTALGTTKRSSRPFGKTFTDTSPSQRNGRSWSTQRFGPKHFSGLSQAWKLTHHIFCYQWIG